MDNRPGFVVTNELTDRCRVQQICVDRHQGARRRPGAILLGDRPRSVVGQVGPDNSASPIEQDVDAALADLPECTGDQYRVNAHCGKKR